MGKYTIHNDPIVDKVVSEHLTQIVDAIKAHLPPQSIILYGSFGRGEGSVMIDNGHLTFLSDYELAVVTPSSAYRRILSQQLSKQMETQIGIEVSIFWMRPRRLYHNQVTNLPFSPTQPSIYMYDLKRGGQTLYGQHLLNTGLSIDPRQISLQSGIRLLINRMARVLQHLSGPTLDGERLKAIWWMNKMILACAESLLVAWHIYHFSYAERNRRFATSASDQLQTKYSPVQIENLVMLVQRATNFKLLPSLTLYPETLDELWEQVVHFTDITFRYLVELDLDIKFDTYAEFPNLFLQHPQVRYNNPYYFPFLPSPFDQQLVNAFRYLRQRRFPPKGFFTHPMSPTNQVVFAIIPPLFMSLGTVEKTTMSQINQAVRRWLEIIEDCGSPANDSRVEWDTLRQRTIWAWSSFCAHMM